ncbi:hypothetical protein EVAR_99176_1 [Eumeta japonica]|uniref:Uncharacterized protein n=1 Tax=Eumeta variegata TaxID=151549 RepID=A0A4C1YTC5_EUMVA|nr:hypothetical protein EVAR_99176_1 [Eumeta japonica]
MVVVIQNSMSSGFIAVSILYVTHAGVFALFAKRRRDRAKPGIEAVARICTGIDIERGEAVPESRMGTGSPGDASRPEAGGATRKAQNTTTVRHREKPTATINRADRRP